MKHINWCGDWEFMYGEPSSFPMMKPEIQMVNLPQDAMISGDVSKDAKGGAETGFYQGTKVSYTKHLELSPEELSGQRYILAFDGCAGIMKLVVNGNTVCRHHYAYSPFQVDITPYLECGDKNRITVTVNNTDEPNSRWYSGTGLYRNVELLTGPAVHIRPFGIFVETREIEGGRAVLKAEITIQNDSNGEQRIPVTGTIAGKQVFETDTLIPAGSTETVSQEFTLDPVVLWDLDSPNLYALQVSAGEDSETARFGVRKVEMDAEHGFRLNGKPLNLKGGCIHHDNGILGACAFHDAEYRKVRLLKKNGFNALRFSHNPVSTEMLEACDELGMLVIDEAFDVWNMEKDDFDFSQYFQAEGETELTNMVLRDQNHPCVFLWSIGNEIPEQGGLSRGYQTSKKLTALVRSLDPTRAVGGALCSFFRGLSDQDNQKYWASIMAHAEELKKNGMVNLDSEYGRSVFDPYTTPFVEDWDVVGYNYLRYQYEPTHKAHPARVMIATESKPRELYEYWDDVKRLPYVIGDFEWTAVDYLGEAGIGNSFYVDAADVQKTAMMMHRAQFPSRTAGTGDFDICGYEKPQMLYRRIVWGSKETTVVTHDPAHSGKIELLGRYSWGDVQHGYSWNAAPGTPMKAEIYSSAPEVELFQNGESLGRQTLTPEQKYKAVYKLTYEPGTLTAVSYDASGTEISRDTVKSAGEPSRITLTKQLCDEKELIYISVEITDADGQRVPWAEDLLQAKVSGDAALQAFGSGRSKTTENYTTGSFTSYEGRALAVLRKNADFREAVLTISSEKYGTGSISLS